MSGSSQTVRESERERETARRQQDTGGMSEDVVTLSLQNIAQTYFEHDLTAARKVCFLRSASCLPQED